ncbi:MAG TPA: acetyl-CoA C-acyltransferase [bacterium]
MVSRPTTNDQRRSAVIVDAIRTPVGRYGGILREVRPDDLAAHVIRELIRRTRIDPNLIEDVIFGAGNQAGEDNRNVARMALLLAGLPVSAAGQTVNRLCGSGMQAVASAAHAIKLGEGDVLIAGGVESMTRAPFVMGKPASGYPRGEMKLQDTTLGWRFTNPHLAEMYSPYSMGETAENVAERFEISRTEQDEFALRSHTLAVRAIQEGRFKDEVAPVVVGTKDGTPSVVDTDEHPRSDTSMEKLAALRPTFRSGGTVTAGNSSGINDGAAALLLASSDRAEELGLGPMAAVLASAVAGVDPAYMGLGPIPATRKVLERTGLSIDDMDVIELNEAFAAQVIPCVRELKIPVEKLNPNGGAIAMGHPIGFSGARLVTTLVHELRRRGGRFGLATMCIGVGQGIALVVENLVNTGS